MKLTSITVENVLGIVRANARLTRPVALFCGHNHNGKTSLAEAVRFALQGDVVARGVTKKKDLQALVHDGAKSGSVEVQRDDGMVMYALLPSGKSTPIDTYVPHKALPYVLDASLFAQLDANERRTFLYWLMGVHAKPEVVIEKLTKRGVDAEKAKRVGPLLKAGFAAACEEAKRKATESKGAWRQVAGEVWGSEKGNTWAADVPAYDAKAAADVLTELKHIDVAIERWNQTIGELQVLERQRSELAAKKVQLQGVAEQVDRREKKLAADKVQLAAAEQDYADAAARAGACKREGLIHDLAAAVAYLLPLAETSAGREEADAVAALDAYEREHGRVGAAGDPEAAARLPKLDEARKMLERAVTNSLRDVADALRARDDIEAIEKTLAEEFDAEGLASARATVEKLRAQRDELSKKSDGYKSAKLAVDSAERKTKEAAAHHADVVAWDQIAAALAPDGIPGEMLMSALGPFNDRLAQSAADAEWARIEVTAEMEIRGGLHERPYKLLSESERWRADAMLAEAISHLSGLKLLLLDRFDVLDVMGRDDLLAWLGILAEQGELDTALVFGTLKAQPAATPAAVETHWIEGGYVGQLKEAA